MRPLLFLYFLFRILTFACLSTLQTVTASAVVKPAHNIGVNVIADELMTRFGTASLFDPAVALQESAKYSPTSYHSAEAEGEAETGDVAAEFRGKLDNLLGTSGSENRNNKPMKTVSATTAGKAGKPPKQELQEPRPGSGLLDNDLKAYFHVEHHTRKLSNLGFFEKDDFLEFD